MTKLRLDWCSQAAARHAIERWHYSRAMPASKLVRIGAWEDDQFVGAIIYGTGANRHLARPFGVEQKEACELVRVALAPGRTHPTSKCVAISLRMLRKQSPGIKVVISYADRKEGHLGIIYQATNWLFLGEATQPYLRVLGQVVHPRSLYERYGRGGQSVAWLQEHVDPQARRQPMPNKLKYVYPFDYEVRQRLVPIAKPYPKNSRAGSIVVDAPADQAGDGGSNPTSAL